MSSFTGGGGTAGNSGNAAAANKYVTAFSPLRDNQTERKPLSDVGKTRKEKVAEAVAELGKDADLVDALNDAISRLSFSPVRPITARGAGSTPSSQNTRKPPRAPAPYRHVQLERPRLLHPNHFSRIAPFQRKV